MFPHVILKKNKKIMLIYSTKFLFFKFFLKKFNLKSNTIFNKFITLLINLYKIYFKKLFYFGKAFKIFKKKFFIRFKSNRGNLNRFFVLSNFYFIRKSKQRFKLKALKIGLLPRFLYFLQKYRSLDVFTWRGIKLSKSILFKKKGKVSGYVEKSVPTYL